MGKVPAISLPGGSDDFHDSSLVDVQFTPRLDLMRVVLSTPAENGGQNLWQLTFSGVLRVEFEITGSGELSRSPIPVEVYSVYRDRGSDEERRWSDRLKDLGEPVAPAPQVQHIVLASSHVRGWGAKSGLEGIQIICRDVRIDPAPPDYRGYEYSRPRIEGS